MASIFTPTAQSITIQNPDDQKPSLRYCVISYSMSSAEPERPLVRLSLDTFRHLPSHDPRGLLGGMKLVLPTKSYHIRQMTKSIMSRHLNNRFLQIRPHTPSHMVGAKPFRGPWSMEWGWGCMNDYDSRYGDLPKETVSCCSSRDRTSSGILVILIELVNARPHGTSNIQRRRPVQV